LEKILLFLLLSRDSRQEGSLDEPGLAFNFPFIELCHRIKDQAQPSLARNMRCIPLE
jgi:hypothetical protein